MITKYVVGFLFNGQSVALIYKNRPQWQRGFMNGIGGHIEEGEAALAAMTREFEEETGCRIDSWKQFARIRDENSDIYFFKATGNYSLKTMTDEQLYWVDYKRLDELSVIHNVHWLVPMALYSKSHKDIYG